MHIGIVAGEASGDILGAALMQSLQQRFPTCHFSGIGGERMLLEDFHSLYPQDRLAVMGFIEPLKRLPELLSIRKYLYRHFIEQQVDVVVAIDSPDFNLALEKKLRSAGIKTVHYVSPSVWAWRKGRIKTIKKSVDWMLTLLPFEADFYRQHDVPVSFVGHPLADQFPLVNDTQKSRSALSELLPDVFSVAAQDENKVIIACLPGSRQGEVDYIGNTLWQAMLQLSKDIPNSEIIIPALNYQRRQQIEKQLLAYPELPFSIVDGHSQTVMSAADCVVMASGTTTLEAMLLKKPMVVVYKKDAFSYGLISRMLTVKHISLPNLLAGKMLVPELLQDSATPEAITQAVKHWLESPDLVAELEKTFTGIHHQLRLNASETASDVIENLMKHKTQNLQQAKAPHQ
ncbi:MAG: lipid-A-disaccharide synthase [Candidatus Endobugula sp.]|jgi:lipid-A-disaccharide synthase